MPELIARRCLVAGLVQGVFFRASTRDEANRLGIVGYAHNLPDGRVEVLVVGEPDAANRLIEWLRHGPPSARVAQVDVEELELNALRDLPIGFSTR